MKSREASGQFGGVFPSRDLVIQIPERTRFVGKDPISSIIAARQYPGSLVVNLATTVRRLQGIPRDHSSTRHGNRPREAELK